MVADLVRYELRTFFRRPVSSAFTLALPIMALLFWASVNENRVTDTGVRFNQFLVPGVVAFAVHAVCFNDLALTLTARRERGVLKRLHLSPASPVAVIGSAALACLAVTVLITSVLLAIGLVLPGVHFSGRYLELAAIVLAEAISFTILAFGVSALVPTVEVAIPVVTGSMLLLDLSSGVFLPPLAGSLVDRLSFLFPVRPFVLAVHDAFQPGSQRQLSAAHVLVVAVWVTAGLTVALRRRRADARS
jgi:ABC-2 type transport system permease protein